MFNYGQIPSFYSNFGAGIHNKIVTVGISLQYIETDMFLGGYNLGDIGLFPFDEWFSRTRGLGAVSKRLTVAVSAQRIPSAMYGDVPVNEGDILTPDEGYTAAMVVSTILRHKQQRLKRCLAR